jgi:Zn-finger nucleic acid-binding protein
VSLPSIQCWMVFVAMGRNPYHGVRTPWRGFAATFGAMVVRDRPMQCPRCGKELVRYEDRDKWRCKACRGALVGIEQLEIEIGELAQQVVTDEADPDRPAIHPCPVCAFPLTPYTIGEIQLDRCVDDRVVWFDGGEIGKVRKTIPLPEDSPLVTNTLQFVLGLREQMRAEAAGEHDDLPKVDPVVITSGEWAERTVCPDGACNGVIGADGACSVCGKRATA